MTTSDPAGDTGRFSKWLPGAPGRATGPAEELPPALPGPDGPPPSARPSGPPGGEGSFEPAKASPSRTGVLWVTMVLSAVVLILLLVFILQNSTDVKVSFFGAHGRLPLGVALLLSAVCGLLLVAVPGTGRIVQLRRQIKRLAAPVPPPAPETAPADPPVPTSAPSVHPQQREDTGEPSAPLSPTVDRPLG